MVRLKVIVMNPPFSCAAISIPLWYEFQFHYGTIKSLSKLSNTLCGICNFNSTMVRLKEERVCDGDCAP